MFAYFLCALLGFVRASFLQNSKKLGHFLLTEGVIMMCTHHTKYVELRCRIEKG